MADLLLSLIAKDEMSDVFGKASGLVLRVKDALVEMVKAAAESERTQRQLKTVAGDLTNAFVAQSEAMSRQLAVDDEVIQKMQTILLRYGEAPAKVEATTRAVLDYAAATGKDAVGATEALTRGVNSGTGSIKELGIEYRATGRLSDDLGRATQALADKFAGAAENDADTFAGRVRRVTLEVDNFKKSIGGLFIEMEAGLGLINKLSVGANYLREALTGQNAGIAGSAMHAGFGAVLKGKPINVESVMRDMASGAAADAVTGGGAGSNRSVGSAGKEAAAEAERLRAWWGEIEFRLESRVTEIEMEQEAARIRKAQKADRNEREDDAMADAMIRAADQRIEITKQKDKELNDAMRAQEREYAQTGAILGAAMVNAFTSELAELAGGGEFDVGAFFGDMLSSLLTIGGAIAGNIIAPGFGGGIGASIGGGIGNVFKAATRRRHDGGWVERFHGGGWPGGVGYDEQPAILQRGERVLSRREVASMGGPAGVDAAARGGGSTVVIQAVDGESVRRLMEGAGGRAFYNAVRLGRGSVPRLFEGG